MSAGYDAGGIRASDSDRTRAQSLLNDAFADGRLTREEWDERATVLGGPVTHADLARLTADLPSPYLVPQPPSAPVSPYQPAPLRSRTNGMAVAALVCGLGQFVAPPFAGIAAIILGHQARRRIRLTGEQGDGMALTGLVLGYIGTIGLVLFLVLGVAFLAVGSVHRG
jgi:hypothetical protein